ncbi:hypothetical protein, variant [Cladophialophora immunda]|uniref:NmrA-like domain-containing protein n=1 Tax=Cladophialophora immunda TaxID=569365 RepID=A0A0D2CYR8_9EURO|nr:uncharacterized protein PV07_01767 [Cladophialophora immunda]XP_016255256.1 hypothetical protein, variant [Cladophialophora immunda]KIW35039.1 hypothetical protein PV07_01767 [Cladophialophora immunda]KIW35040.1 hypothetical protein, variant [Cladophialophora immunda]OQV09843.1 hypothetical protein CLAIMM_13925 isoform 1 [Cladophialophora immunda]OQV09844.1 hypothetical protein CLAIMM_13925 isoform 2 [Cladophialophora immunda]
MKTIVFIGGTGAQGSAIIKTLSSTNQYKILALTRSTTSSAAQDIGSLPNVELVESNATFGYDVERFFEAAQRSDYAFINTDGFALGEQAETYWGIRLFELSVRAGVKHLIWSGLDYNGKKTGYDPKFYVGHYEGKARVTEWMRSQPTSPMGWTVINSGPYIEMLWELLLPERGNDDVYKFKLPLGQGAIPFVHLDDFGRYAAWIYANQDEANGKVLGIAVAHVSGPALAQAFTATTGKKAEYIDEPVTENVEKHFRHLPKGADTKVGITSVKDENALLMTFRENFTNWWHLYQNSADNKGVIKRDYALLDRILPNRIKSAEEWMKKVGYDATRRSVITSRNRVPPA